MEGEPPTGPSKAVAGPSLQLRLGKLVLATTWCFLVGGVAFGWPPLALMLKLEGVFLDGCPEYPSFCKRREESLQTIFTVEASFFNYALLFAGIVLDIAGPRVTVWMGLLLAMFGSLTFGTAGKENFYQFVVGMSILSIGGASVVVSSYNVSNLFPRGRVYALSVISTCRNSTAVFLAIMQQVYLWAPDSFGYHQLFLYVYPSLITMAVLSVPYVWAWKPYEVLARPPASPGAESPPLRSSPRPTLASQLFSWGWVLMNLPLTVSTLHTNFYIGTVRGQLFRVFGPDEVDRWVKIFSLVLPLGGLPMLPLVGWLVDQRGIKESFVWLGCSGVVLGLVAIPPHIPFVIITWVVFSFFRTLLFTVATSYLLFLFGTPNFGRLWGMATCVAATVNFSGAYIDIMTWNWFDGDYTVANMGFAVLSVVTFTLPLYMHVLDKRERARMRELGVELVLCPSPSPD